MSSYDFHQLSPHDLELLTRDLLQVHWDTSLESFKAGRDGGIDLRYAEDSNSTIVQVKHYAGTGFDGLLRNLKKEADKVSILSPARYVLVTSVPLSPANKSAIVAIIGPNFLSASDVLGQEDLNNLLGQYPNIEQQHFKLWLASTAVLTRVLHNAVLTRSEIKTRQIYDEARRYVPSNAYPEALKMLSESRIVVISGPPGVGKTTLGKLLIYTHLERGYQAVYLQNNFKEGEDLFRKDLSQIFYFDDFLGSTYLGERSTAFPGREDRAISDFLALIRSNPKARLVLTTREHILSQANEQSEVLRNTELGAHKVVLNMPSYSTSQKAEILYNHVYFSELPIEYRKELLRDDFFMRIIKHEKYNPRLIEWLSNYHRLSNVPVAEYQVFIQGLLDDPSEIWRHAYEQETSNAGRSLLLALFSVGGKCEIAYLQKTFVALHEYRAERYRYTTEPNDFKLAMKETLGSFIKLKGKSAVRVIDPSVIDLLNSVAGNAPDNVIDIISSSIRFEQIKQMLQLTGAAGESELSQCIELQRAIVSEALSRFADENRRVELGDSSVAFYGPSFEHRLAVVIDLAERYPFVEFQNLIPNFFSGLEHEWKSSSPNISESLDLLKKVEHTENLTTSARTKISKTIRTTLLSEAVHTQSSREMRSLIDTLNMTSTDELLNSAQSSFEAYRQRSFKDDLDDCRSHNNFNDLVDNLAHFRDILGVDIESMVEAVREEHYEFAETEAMHENMMEDQWQENRHEQRSSDQEISNMFASLVDEDD